MSNNIDFGTIPNIFEKISADEIQKLNDIFQQPKIVEKLKEIEHFRKKRQVILALVTIFIVIPMNIIAFYLGGWTIIPSVIIGSLFIYIPVYKKFYDRIEFPLKRDIMEGVCKVIDTNFEYSHDGKYSFNDIGTLVAKKFINEFNTIDLLEDSVKLSVKHEGKEFTLNGFELHTSETEGTEAGGIDSGYFMKIKFPHARIPMLNDLVLLSKEVKSAYSRATFIIGAVFMLFWLFFGIIGATAFPGELRMQYIIMTVSLFLIIVIGAIILQIQKKYIKKKNKIDLENIEFGKIFEVQCDDEISSRMILTPAFMDKLVTFVTKQKNNYNFLFSNNCVYIVRKISIGYMEVKTNKNMFQNLEGFLDFYIDLKEVVLLSRELNLLYLSRTNNGNSAKNKYQK